MIITRQDLKNYLKTECYSANGGGRMRDYILPPPNYEFIRRLRIFEYHSNSSGFYHKLMTLWHYWRYYRISVRTGISIPRNVCEKGLTLYHYGSIVVNHATKIGKNCCIMNNVNIGANQGSSRAPQIGNDVYIGPGVVIFGDISIADGCYIGANAVVNKSILDKYSVVVGVPAKVVGHDNIHWWQKNKLNR